MVGVAPEDDDAEAAMDRETAPRATHATPGPAAGDTVIITQSAPPDTSQRTDGKLYIEQVESVSGEKKDGSGRWTKHNVTFSDGQQASTFNGPLAADCERFRISQTAVRIMTTPASNPKWNDTLDLCEPDPQVTAPTSEEISF